MTLMFSFAQAVASSDAKATMISPYVARIQDWWVLNHNKQYPIEEHPGLLKVADIWRYFKFFGLKTAILVANCRKGDEVLQLSGCDRHTIGPAVLEELRSKQNCHISRRCKPEDIANYQYKKIEVPDEKTFRWMLNGKFLLRIQFDFFFQRMQQPTRNWEMDLESLVLKLITLTSL